MPTIACLYWLLLFGLVSTIAGREAVTAAGSPLTTRSNFLRAAVQGGRRERYLWCSDNLGVCLDRTKNPWGGTTCCFQRFCKDTTSDPDHCGGCGHRCAYGMMCCDGRCVDVQNDPYHCGSCSERCPGQLGCRFAMCDYGGG